MKYQLLFAFLLSSVLTFAQKVGIEFSAGFVASTIKASDLIISGEPKSRFSLTTNVLFNFPISEFFRIQTGLGYSSRGCKLESSWGFYPMYGSETYKVKMNYIELPFLLSLGPENIYVLAGPQLSILVKSDVQGIEKNDFGLKYGLGFNANRVTIRLLLYNGLTNMIDSPDYFMENKNISFTVGWMLVQARSKKKEKDTIHRIID